jgi:lysophospholipid acyltransferase (LPLAT)-like uncharacterized protein
VEKQRADQGGWRAALVAGVAAGLIRLLRATVRLSHHGDAEMRRMEREGERFLIAFWHRHILLMPYCYRGRRITVLVSQHRDGELIARTVAHFGIHSSRGSTTRGGAAGVREMLRRFREGYDLAVTPDGPKGPRGVVKPGAVQLAALAEVPIQPVSLGASRCRRLDSWDGFVIPLPGSRVSLVYGEPFWVRRDADLAESAMELGRRLDALEVEAVALARGGPRGKEPLPEVADA